MAFNPELRRRLMVLKEERESGLLPQVVYEELCRKAIHDLDDCTNKHDSNYQQSQSQQEDDHLPSKVCVNKPIGNKNQININAQEILSSAESIIIFPTSSTASQADDIYLPTLDETDVGEKLRCNDKRKFNKGLNFRRRYSKEDKLLVVALRDSEVSCENIAKYTGVCKSNVEKWNGDKAKDQIIQKASAMLNFREFSRNNITFETTSPELLGELISRVTAKKMTTLHPSCALFASLLRQSTPVIEIRTERPYTVEDPETRQLFMDAFHHTNVMATPDILMNQPDKYTNACRAYNPSWSKPIATSKKRKEMSTSDVESSEPASGDMAESDPMDGSEQVDHSNSERENEQNDITQPSNNIVSNGTGSSSDTDHAEVDHLQPPPSQQQPPAKRSRLMEELAAAVELYYDEENKCCSMELASEERTTGRGVNNHNSTYFPTDHIFTRNPAPAIFVPTSFEDLMQDKPEKITRQLSLNSKNTSFLHVPICRTVVSDLTMSFSSAMLDNTFSLDNVSMGVSTQALRPVVNSTAIFTSFHGREGKRRVIEGVKRDGESEEQYEEDRKILRLLGEQQYVRGKLIS